MQYQAIGCEKLNQPPTGYCAEGKAREGKWKHFYALSTLGTLGPIHFTLKLGTVQK